MDEKLLNEHGNKAYQREDEEDRCLPFRHWHRNRSKPLYATDVDLIEWTTLNGELIPCATLELTAIKDSDSTDAYREQILERFFDRDSFQMKAITKVAACLGVPAFIVLINEGCTKFWVYPFRSAPKRKWYSLDGKTLEDWLITLRTQARRKNWPKGE